jgi:glycosyltransferase involved in cell wall biosynthesis
VFKLSTAGFIMKKIAINTRLLLKGRLEGLGTFEQEVLQRLVKDHPEVEFHFIFDRPYHPDFIYGSNVAPHVLFPQARHPFLYIWWFNYNIPRLLKKIQADVFFSPDGYLSLRTNIPQIPVIHDINFFHYPQYFRFWHRWHYNTYFPQFAKKATKIITISEFSKQDISTSYHIDPSKITVAYNGIEQSEINFSKEEIQSIRGKYTQGKSYFISIGALYPRKNLENQLRAFDLFKSNSGSDMKFLIVGKSYPESESIFETHRSLQHQKDVIFLGRIEPRKEVDLLLAGALACSYVSNFEGFGLPILEAMRCHVPVITSNVSALPEVAGAAAILADPGSVEQIAQAYQTLVSDELLRHELISKGTQQFKKFTWEVTAHQIWEVIESIR